jgi:hypothetical protein
MNFDSGDAIDAARKGFPTVQELIDKRFAEGRIGLAGLGA